MRFQLDKPAKNSVITNGLGYVILAVGILVGAWTNDAICVAAWGVLLADEIFRNEARAQKLVDAYAVGSPE